MQVAAWGGSAARVRCSTHGTNTLESRYWLGSRVRVQKMMSACCVAQALLTALTLRLAGIQKIPRGKAAFYFENSNY
jgi:hypothetical protein